MKIDTLGNLVSSFSPKNTQIFEEKATQGAEAQASAPQNDEAAMISTDVGMSAVDQAAHQQKFERIRNEVNTGTYQQPNSQDLATAIVKELGSM